MQVVDWAEPTGRQTSSGANRLVADALKAAPIDEKDGMHKWAIVEEHLLPDGDDNASKETAKNIRAKASNRASLIKQGRLGPFKPKGTFDAVSRTEPLSVEWTDGTEGPAQKIESPEKVVRVYARYKGEEYAEPELVVEEEASIPSVG